MSKITRAVIEMPFEMAMQNETSRRQYYSIARSFLADRNRLMVEVEALREALIKIRDNSISLWSCETAADALVDSRKKTKEQNP